MRPSADSETTTQPQQPVRRPGSPARRPAQHPCPYLGIVDDPATAFAFATPANACFCEQPGVKKPYTTVQIAHQEAYCLSPVHTTCPIYQQAAASASSAAAADTQVERVPLAFESATTVSPAPARKLRRPFLIAVVLLLLTAALLFFGRDYLPARGETLDSNATRQTISTSADEDGTATAKPSTPVTTGPSSPKAAAGAGGLPLVNSPTATSSPAVTPTATPSPAATVLQTPAVTATTLPTATETPSPAATATTSPSPTPQPTSCGPPAGWVPYTVQAGENLFRISLRHNTSVAVMMRANCLTTTYVYTGQRLLVPFHAPTSTPQPEPTATDAPPPPPQPTDPPPPPPPPTEPPPPTPTAPIIETPTVTPPPDPATATVAPTETRPQQPPNDYRASGI